MKLLPILLLNVAVVGGGLFAYDQLRTEEPAPAEPEAPQTVELGDLEARVKALEAQPAPPLQAEGLDPRVAKQLEALASRIEALEKREPTETPVVDGNEPQGESTPKPMPSGEEPKGEPTKEEVARFKKLQSAAYRERRLQRIAKRVKSRLASLDLSLTPEQQKQLVAAYADFEPRRDEIWTEVKQNTPDTTPREDWGQIITDTNARIQREFTERITPFIPAADAETISEGLLGGK